MLLRSVVWLTLLTGPTPLAGQGNNAAPGDLEHRVKAAYLYQFGRYVTWPAKVFPTARSPFVIAVPAESPVAPHLDEVAKTKSVLGRSIEIRRFAAQDEAPACHILFLPSTLAADHQKTLIRQVTGKFVLVVGESEGVLKAGGEIRFVLEQNNVRLQIALKTAEREGFAVSARLLQVARVVD